jgi:UDP-glucose:(heptosyl)LPS alpha-1,3-glucosyltransferase
LEATVAGVPIIATDTCGYASYITAANSGIVLASPFSQTQYNQALQKLLTTDNSEFRQNGIAFGTSQNLYDMPKQVIDELEARA